MVALVYLLLVVVEHVALLRCILPSGVLLLELLLV